MDTLLLQKNKQLQTECASLRIEKDRLFCDITTTEHTLKVTQNQCAKYEEQIEQLEHDMIRYGW